MSRKTYGKKTGGSSYKTRMTSGDGTVTVQSSGPWGDSAPETVPAPNPAALIREMGGQCEASGYVLEEES